MHRSKAEIYLHFVWATYRRLPLVSAEVEQALYACIMEEARRCDCETLAIGGMPDHVHLVVQIPTVCSAAKLMQRVKGVSSALARQQLVPGELFGWQDAYGVFSVSRSHKGRVVAYVHNQKRHHAAGKLWPEWEQAGEEIAPR